MDSPVNANRTEQQGVSQLPGETFRVALITGATLAVDEGLMLKWGVPCGGTVEVAMTGINHESAMRVSDADRNGTLRRLHNAVALGLIDIDEFEERSAMVSQARLHSD